jgi:hypothetical protein
MTAIAGLRGSTDFAADERPKNFREFIVWRNRAAQAPLFAMSSRANKEQVSDAEFNWWDEPMIEVRLQVDATFASTVTTLTVDSADPSTSAPGNYYGEATHLKPGDLLLVEPTSAGEAAAFVQEIVAVTQVISSTQVQVSRGAANTTAASIPNDAYLMHIGSAYAEGTASPQATSRNPMKYSNYAQIFKTAYEITGTAEVTSYRTGDPVKNDKKRKAFDHASSIEFALLFGNGYEGTGDNSKPIRYTKGLRRFIPTGNSTIFSAAVTVSSFLDAVYPVFDYVTDAGDERVMFLGNKGLNELNKIVLGSGDMVWGEKITTLGLTLRELIIPQGTLYVRTHPQFNRHSWLQNSAMLVDFSALRWRHTKGRDTKFMDNIQAKDEDLRRGQWFTEGGLEVWYGGMSLGYLGNISAT